MNKFFKRISKILIMYSLSFGNAQAIKYEIPHKNLTYMINDEDQTAIITKVSKDSNNNAPLDIPSFVEFCKLFYRVVGLANNCIDEHTFSKINKINIPYTIKKDSNNKKIFFSLLSSPNIGSMDKFIIKDYFDNKFDKNLSERQKNSPLRGAVVKYSIVNGVSNY